MKILIAAFDPFAGEVINPAWEAVKNLSEELDGAKLQKVQIPTIFYQSKEVLETGIKDSQPDYVLVVGQAGGRNAVTPERVAINIDDARITDNAGQQPIDQSIQTDGPAAYFSKLPVKAMVERMRVAGIPANLSNSAGTFVCNHILYQLLYLLDKTFHQVKAGGFIHVPFIPKQVVDKPGQPSMSLETISKGLEVSLQAIIDYDGQADVNSELGAIH